MNHMIVRNFEAMACSWTISCFAQTNLSKKDSESLINEAIEFIHSFESYYTVFRESPFNRINIMAAKERVKVSKECIQILKDCVSYYEKTNGHFDITYKSPLELRNISNIEIDEDNQTVFLPHKEMKISLGGIGKGIAVDMAFNFLKKSGLINFIVNGSGDIKVHSHINAPRPWKIGIKNPFNPSFNIGQINLKNEAIATSGRYLKQNHILSTESSPPLSVTVLGKDTAYCDVMATYLSTLSAKKAQRTASQLDLYSIIIDQTGEVLHSKKSLESLTRRNL